MGRGIIESGLFRAERYELEQRTSDPANPEPGEEWLRVDVKPEYEDADGNTQTGVAEYRRVNADGTTETAPVAQLGDSTGENVIDKVRAYVDAGGSPTGKGFLPFATRGASYPEKQLEHPTDGRAGLHDALTAESAIPDSAVYRWPVDEGSGQTLTDELQSEEITTNFETWVTGSQYVGGAAVSFDGDGDEATADSSLSELSVSNDFSVEIWVDLGSVSSDEAFLYQQPADDDRVGIGIDRDDSDYVAVGVYDGSPHELQFDHTQHSGLVQIVVTWDASASDVGLYHNATESTAGGNLNFSGSAQTPAPFGVGYHTALDLYTDCIIDLIQPHDEVLSQSQVDDIYDEHPST